MRIRSRRSVPFASMMSTLAMLPLALAACAVQSTPAGAAPVDVDVASTSTPMATITPPISTAAPLPSVRLHESPPASAARASSGTLHDELKVAANCTRTGNQLSFCNGPLIGDAAFYPVTWTPNVYAPVALDIVPFLGALYTGYAGSDFLSWLDEYSENFQDLDFGSNAGRLYNIYPQLFPNTTTLSIGNIQLELSYQFDQGTLPLPNPYNNVYIINFPPGYTLTNGNLTGCVSGGFTGYHAFGSWHGVTFRFIVMPDYSQASACSTNKGIRSVPS